MQAVQLLIMYGADASIQNCYMQTPPYLALSDECLQLFDLLERDGELCRHDLRQRLADDREEAAALQQEKAAEQERRCAPAVQRQCCNNVSCSISAPHLLTQKSFKITCVTECCIPGHVCQTGYQIVGARLLTHPAWTHDLRRPGREPSIVAVSWLNTAQSANQPCSWLHVMAHYEPNCNLELEHRRKPRIGV